MCAVVVVVVVVDFFPRIVLCAILLYLSIVVVVVQFGFFLYIFILSTSLEFQFTLCCCFAVSCLHSAALSRRTLPLPLLSWQTSLLFSLSHFTQIRHALVHVHVFIACERVLLICDSLNARTGALSLSCPFLFTLSAFAHILNCFATCGKSTSRLVAHFAFDSTVAISALSSPTPNICICLHLCVCVHILMLFCVGVLRLSLVVCSTCDSRFIFCQLQQRLRAASRQPPDELVC